VWHVKWPVHAKTRWRPVRSQKLLFYPWKECKAICQGWKRCNWGGLAPPEPPINRGFLVTERNETGRAERDASGCGAELRELERTSDTGLKTNTRPEEKGEKGDKRKGFNFFKTTSNKRIQIQI
jgi:hypothetical protein